MTKEDNQSLEDNKSTENSNEENKDLNTLSYEELLQKVTDSEEEVLRSRAELENFKKRTSNEITNTLKYANSELLSSLIPVITSLEKAIENSKEEKNIDKEGILLILNSFEKTLEDFNIVPIKPTGKEFDPEKHEAVSTVNNQGEKDNIVIETLERGWKLNERVVKPALVIVNKN
jgi:molecular chaperone GrpE